MLEQWQRLLPGNYRRQVLDPVSFEYRTEPSANSERLVGFDSLGNKCFHFHSFVLTEEGFDVDEFPIQVDVYYECVYAWKLRQGNWIRIKSYADRIGQCGSKLNTLPAELTASIY